MAQDSQQRIDEAREKAEQYEAEAEALEALRDEVLNADRIADTRLSGLFHEARTTRKGYWKSVHAFVNIGEDGKVVVDSLDKLSDGYWSPETRDRYDAILSVPVRPFMETDMFKSIIRDEISQAVSPRRQNAHRYREDAKTLARMERYEQEQCDA